MKSNKCTKGQPRISTLSEDAKAKIESMASPSELQRDERKRQYSALRRAIIKSCSPSLLAKFSLCRDGERLGVVFFQLHTPIPYPPTDPAIPFPARFTMLKQFMLADGKVDTIEVEERYVRWTEQLRSDRYVTVPSPNV